MLQDQTNDHYVLIVDPNREHLAVERLNARGFVAYSPRIHRRMRHRGRLVDTCRPMFTCYAFIQAPVAFAEVEQVPGVWRFMTVAQRPAVLSDAIVTAIKAKEDQLERLHRARRGPTGEFTPGQDVLIRVGMFADMLARVDRLDEKGRIEVLFEMMGAERRATVRHHELIAA